MRRACGVLGPANNQGARASQPQHPNPNPEPKTLRGTLGGSQNVHGCLQQTQTGGKHTFLGSLSQPGKVTQSALATQQQVYN